jgi:Phosphotransferase enzyme family
MALGQVHRYACGLAPEPISADLDAVPPTVTMTVVAGEPLGGSLAPAQLTALAIAITTLWAVPHDDPAVIEPWSDDLSFARTLTEGPRPAGGVSARAFDAAHAWWDGNDPMLLQTPPQTTVLGHRDPNLANYLWDGTHVRIVDLEDAAVSDPATEVAILLEHLSARDLDTDDFCGRLTVDQPRLHAARRVWAMFWLRLLLPGGPAEARNPPGTAELQAERLLDLLT